jgi:hypothetical protein
MIDLTIPEPKQEVAATDDASLARGKALLQRAQQAMGGAEKLVGIKNFTEVLDLQLSRAQGGFTMKQTIRYLAPSHYRQDQTLPFGNVIAYINGNAGWLSTPQGTQDMPAEIVKQAQDEAYRTLLTLVVSDRLPGRIVNAIGPATVEISAAGQSARLEFDPATGLPSRLTFRAPGPTGVPADVTETMSDFRDVAGFKLPFKVVTDDSITTIASYTFNTGLTPEEIGKRP